VVHARSRLPGQPPLLRIPVGECIWRVSGLLGLAVSFNLVMLEGVNTCRCIVNLRNISFEAPNKLETDEPS
jgi:hypothetical protein